MPQTRFVLRKALELNKKVGFKGLRHGAAPKLCRPALASPMAALSRLACPLRKLAQPCVAIAAQGSSTFSCRLQVVVVVNKIDRPAARWVTMSRPALLLHLASTSLGTAVPKPKRLLCPTQSLEQDAGRPDPRACLHAGRIL